MVLRTKQLPLTETVFYILLALLEPSHGYSVMQEVEKLSDGEVRIAAGTLYGAFENLLKAGFIELVAEENRRKIYCITDLGRQILVEDTRRMEHMVSLIQKEDIYEEEN